MKAPFRLALSWGRRFIARRRFHISTNQSLAGTLWNYRIVSPAVPGDAHRSFVYKAEVLPHQGVSNPPKWALIKTTDKNERFPTESLRRERMTYLLPSVASATCFRKLYDVIGNDTDGEPQVLALEWLDTTLDNVKFQHEKVSYAIVIASLEAALNSCIILEGNKMVNTDFKDANILLSGVGTSEVTAKVGDLGLVFPDASRYQCQPMAMRAPEVWLGYPCTKESQVWAIAAMLLCFIKPDTLGEWDAPQPRPQMFPIWSIAKIGRLFPEWDLQPREGVEDIQILIPIDLARKVIQAPPGVGGLERISPFEEEIQKAKIPQELVELLRFMLVPDQNRRPSPADVLASEQLRAFKKFVRSN